MTSQGLLGGPFPCNICGREFKTKGGLGSHRRGCVAEVNSPPTSGEPTGAQAPVTFRSPKALELRVVVVPDKWVRVVTPAGTMQEVVKGKVAEFRDGVFTTTDPQIIDFLENKYHDIRFPIVSPRLFRDALNQS